MRSRAIAIAEHSGEDAEVDGVGAIRAPAGYGGRSELDIIAWAAERVSQK